ncbi:MULTISPECIES: hypothetical protein [Hyphomonas]|uniref:hypothetical protein n=1 Tax=Hyphomonas TaxID=85 RepID=UPI0012EB6ACF|nr:MULTISPECIES: hypothetical protein [Hyphomonas]
MSLYATTVSHGASAASEPGERVRLKAAAQRFLADVRLAAASPELPLRRAGQPASADPEVALGRLAALESAIGLNLFRQLECLLVDGAAEQVFARESGHKVHEAQGAALAALRTLARAYDLAVPRRRA